MVFGSKFHSKITKYNVHLRAKEHKNITCEREQNGMADTFIHSHSFWL